jgi:hypothetical protein
MEYLRVCKNTNDLYFFPVLWDKMIKWLEWEFDCNHEVMEEYDVACLKGRIEWIKEWKEKLDLNHEPFYSFRYEFAIKYADDIRDKCLKNNMKQLIEKCDFSTRDSFGDVRIDCDYTLARFCKFLFIIGNQIQNYCDVNYEFFDEENKIDIRKTIESINFYRAILNVRKNL